MKKARIAILGYGVIGKGVFKICLEKEEIEVIKIFDYKENFDKQYANLFTDNLLKFHGFPRYRRNHR